MDDISALEAAYLIRLYTDQGTSVDRLAYTVEIENMAKSMRIQFNRLIWTEAKIYNVLISFRKSGFLPTIFRNKAI